MKRPALIIIAIIVCLIAVFLIISNIAIKEPPQASLAEQLYAARVDAIGNASACGNLLALLDSENRLGLYTLELQTEREPYGLAVIGESNAPDMELLRGYAIVLLALIDNAGEIEWRYADNQFGVDTAGADSLLSRDVKSYAASAADVQALLDELEL